MAEAERRQERLDAELVHAVREDMPGFVRMALDAGANPNAPVEPDGVNVLFAIQARHHSGERSEVLEMLLNAGADAQARDEQGNTLMHLAAGMGADGVVVQMLEAGVDPLSTNDRGLTPLQNIFDRSTHQAAGRLEYAMHTPRVALDETLTHHHLFGHDTLGNAPIDNSLSWHIFPRIVEQLEKNGEPPITKDDLLTCDKTGKPRIARAVLCYNWDDVQDYLTARGEPITHEDLLGPDGTGRQIAGALAARERLGAFFSAEYWADKPMGELVETWRKLDGETRETVGSIHALRHDLLQMRQQESRGR